MKKLFMSLIFSAISFTSYAETGAINNRDSASLFSDFYNKGATVFKGRAQNFSLFNLDLEALIHYMEPIVPDAPYTFTIASNGNQEIHGDPAFAIQGDVKFEILDPNGKLAQFKASGFIKSFPKVLNRLYLYESDLGLKQRTQRRQILNAKYKNQEVDLITGRLIAEVSFYLFKQTINFYQLDDENNLTFIGTFEGRSFKL